MKKGKLFESATKKVVEKLHPTQEVLSNVTVFGKFSKHQREIDVKLVDPSNYEFISFECKDHKRPVDVGLVESFITKLQDIQAKKGAIVSNSGFTPSAENVAESFGVDTLALVDTGNKKIKSKIFASMLIEEIYIKYFNIELSTSTIKRFSVPTDHYRLKIKAPSGANDTAYKIFARLWNEGDSPLSLEPGAYEYKFEKQHHIQMLSNEGVWIDLDKLSFNYEVRKRYFQGKIEMIDTCGLYDVRRKTYQTKSMSTSMINPSELRKEWPEITESELKIRKNEFGLRLVVIVELPDEYMGE